MDVIARALAEFAPAPTSPDATPKDTRRRSLRTAPFRLADEPEMAVENVPAMIAEVVDAYLAEPLPGRMLLLALPPGSGKTTAMVGVAERVAASGARVLYAGPRHDFFADVQALAAHPSWWYAWQPRHEGSETREATCRYAPQMARWLHRGYQALDFCKAGGVCGWAYIKNQCPYHAQQRVTHPIIYAMHQHVSLRHPLMGQMGLLIGDELPLGAFLNPWVIPPGSVVLEEAAPDIDQLLRTLYMLCHTPAPREGGWTGPALLAELGGPAYVADLCARYATLRPGIDIIEPTIRAPDDVDHLDYAHLPYLLSLLEQESRASLDGMPDYVRRIRCSPDGLTLLMRRRPGPLPSHIIWCDATGDPRLYERLFGVPVQVVRPRVRMAGTVRQVYASLNNKSSLGGTPDGDEARQAQARKLAGLHAQVAQVVERGGYQAPALITYKSLADTLADPLGAERGHFGAERGTNRMAACDALLVVGTPQPPAPQIVEMAAMLYDERIEPFNATWSTREIAYEGQPFAWPIGGFWDDPDLQTILGQFRDAELMQAIHRARPLRRQVDVWLLTNAPVPGLPVELLSLHDLFDAPDGVDPYAWPALRRYVAERLAQVGRVTAPDIVTAAGVQPAAARRYLEALARQDGYQLARAPAEGRGRPPLCIVRPQ